MKEPNIEIVDKLLSLVEKTFNNGERNSWTHQNFVDLSKEIKAKTREFLSASTLKRLFGKVETSSLPRQSSLDILAAYTNHKDWYNYKQEQASSFSLARTKKTVALKKGEYIWVLAFFFISIIAFFIFTFSIEEYNKKQNFVFFSQDTIGDIPHMINVHIDISSLKGSGFYLTHPAMKEEINITKADTLYQTYLSKPGIKDIALYQKGTLLKTIKFFSKTSGWVAEISREGFEKNIYVHEGKLINDTVLTLATEHLTSNVMFSFFTRVKYSYGDVTNISLDSFRLSTRFRYIKTMGFEECTRTYLTFNGTKEFISIPLTHPSCLKGMDLYLENRIIPTIHYPEEFSGDIEEWQEIEIVKRGTDLKLFRNEKFIFESEVQRDWGTFFMVNYLFMGNGAIDYVRLYDNNDSLCFAHEFNVHPANLREE